MERQIVIPARANADYSSHFKALDAQYLGDVEHGAAVLQGPQYHIASPSGFLIRVEQVITQRQMPNGNSLQRYYLLAFNDQEGHKDEILGHTKGEIQIPQERTGSRRGQLRVNTLMHMTVSAVRSESIGSSLELVHAFYLQNLANALGSSIEFTATNGNVVNLIGESVYDLGQFFGHTLTQQDIQRFRAQRDEQVAWQHIWGKHGILGMRRNKRIFSPQGASMLEARDIWLERTPKDASGKVDVKVVRAA